MLVTDKTLFEINPFYTLLKAMQRTKINSISGREFHTLITLLEK